MEDDVKKVKKVSGAIDITLANVTFLLQVD